MTTKDVLFGAIHEHATVEVIDYEEEINSEVSAKAAKKNYCHY